MPTPVISMHTQLDSFLADVQKNMPQALKKALYAVGDVYKKELIEEIDYTQKVHPITEALAKAKGKKHIPGGQLRKYLGVRIAEDTAFIGAWRGEGTLKSYQTDHLKRISKKDLYLLRRTMGGVWMLAYYPPTGSRTHRVPGRPVINPVAEDRGIQDKALARVIWRINGLIKAKEARMKK